MSLQPYQTPTEMELSPIQKTSLKLCAAKIASESLEAWLLIFHHRNTIGQRTTFQDREWMIPLVMEKSRRQVVKKAVQCGVTNLLEVITFAEMMRGHFVLYAMPTDTDRNDFINTRINPAIQNVPLYKSGAGNVGNIGIKQMWNGGLKAVGSNRKASFASYAAQTIIIDEVDLCNMENLIFAEDRTAATKLLFKKMMDEENMYPRLVNVGNPSVPGYGISEMYDASDQKHYMFKCISCNEWQAFDWFENVVSKVSDNVFELRDKAGPHLVCHSCNRPILLDDVKKEWVAKYPELTQKLSGWQISQLFTKQYTVEELYDSFLPCINNPTKMQAFMNSKMGMEYTGDGDALDMGVLQRCRMDYAMPKSAKGTIGGIDVGKQFHVRIDKLISGNRKMYYAGTCDTEEELIRTLIRFGVKTACMDADPETHTARRIQQKLRQRKIALWLVRYNTNVRLSGKKIDRKKGYITVNRTESLDKSLSGYIEGRVIIPFAYKQLDKGEWVKQMMAPVRMLDMKRNPPAYVWVEGNKDDHHRHADNYCHIAAELTGFGNRQYKIQYLRV